MLVTLLGNGCQESTLSPPGAGNKHESGRNVFMRLEDLYEQAHLFVAATRVWQYQHHAQPCVEDLCAMLDLSLEQGNLIARKLKDQGIIDEVESAAGRRLFIKDHLQIEKIPREIPPSRLEEEVRKFQNTQKNMARKVETFQAEQARKRKDLFAEMEKKLKKELDKD
jgi:hypothetical protein